MFYSHQLLARKAHLGQKCKLGNKFGLRCFSSYGTKPQPPPMLTPHPPSPPPDMIDPSLIPLGCKRDGLLYKFPNNPHLELRLVTCPVRGYKAHQIYMPNLRVHGLRTADVDNQTHLVYHLNHFVREYERPYAIKEALEIAESQLRARGISKDKLLDFWYSDGKMDATDHNFIGGQIIKHSRYCFDVAVSDYVPFLYNLASPLLDGGPSDIRVFLEDEGFVVGRYYNSEHLVRELELRYGRKVYVTFKKDGSTGIVYIDELGFLRTIHGVLIDHPMCRFIPPGKFLRRHI